MLRLLIDECLTPQLAGRARQRGHHALHVGQIGKLGKDDRKLVAYLLAEDLVMVTNNGRDFARLLQRISPHPGLIVIIPTVRRSEQVRFFDIALDAAEAIGDPVNTLIQVHVDGRVEIQEWPAT